MSDIQKIDTKNPKLIYILYLVGLIVGITSIVGLVMAFMNKSEASEVMQQHYEFQIRTFGIGLLYGVIGAILTKVLIGYLVLIGVLIWWIVRCIKGMQALDKGQPPADVKTWLF